MAFNPRALGCKCDECPRKGATPVPPEPRAGARWAWVGQDPGKNEVRELRPFVGATGQRLAKLWGTACAGLKVSVPRTAIHVTNACLCRPPEDESPKDTRRAVDACRPRLVSELNRLHPKAAVLLLGKWAWYAVSRRLKGQTKFLGFLCPFTAYAAKDLRADQRWYMTTVHPAATFRQVMLLNPLSAHIENFVQAGLEPWGPGPRVDVNPAPALLRALLQRAREERLPIAVDVESGFMGLLPGFARLRAVGVGIASGAGWGMSWSWPMRADVRSILKAAFADPQLVKVFQNGIGYDIPILSRYGFKVR